jgi:hypothetical protein
MTFVFRINSNMAAKRGMRNLMKRYVTSPSTYFCNSFSALKIMSIAMERYSKVTYDNYQIKNILNSVDNVPYLITVMTGLKISSPTFNPVIITTPKPKLFFDYLKWKFKWISKVPRIDF